MHHSIIEHYVCVFFSENNQSEGTYAYALIKCAELSYAVYGDLHSYKLGYLNADRFQIVLLTHYMYMPRFMWDIRMF